MHIHARALLTLTSTLPQLHDHGWCRRCPRRWCRVDDDAYVNLHCLVVTVPARVPCWDDHRLNRACVVGGARENTPEAEGWELDLNLPLLTGTEGKGRSEAARARWRERAECVCVGEGSAGEGESVQRIFLWIALFGVDWLPKGLVLHLPRVCVRGR